MRNNTTYLRKCWMLLLFAVASSCGREPGLLVRLTEWPEGAESLRVVRWFDGERRDELLIPKAKGERGFVVTIPEGESGELRLQIAAQDGGDCKVASAEVTEMLGPGFHFIREQDVRLAPLPVPTCHLVLEFPDGRSRAESSNAELNCRQGCTLCAAELPQGMDIAIHTVPFDQHKLLGFARHDQLCPSEGNCSFPLQRSQRIRFDLAPRICSVDGICWYNPLSQGNSLQAAWGSDANNIWVVGDRGTILKWNGGSWSPQISGTTQHLRGVWGSDANNVWAVGDGGVILWWNGGFWSLQSSYTTQDLNGVWGSKSNRVWVVGSNGTLLKWNGSAWSRQESGSTQHLYGVWGSDSSNVWVVGDNGALLKWNGSSWYPKPSGIRERLWGVWGSDVGDVWIVGENGRILKWSGSHWSYPSSGTTQSLHGVWGSNSDSVWAVGSTGTVLKWDGRTWTPQPSGTTQHLWSVRGGSADNIWAVGDYGIMLRWNGYSWWPQHPGTIQDLHGVWGSDANNVWVVGDNGTILKWNGT